MSSLLPKLWAKITALILFILTVLLFIPSAAGIGYLVFTDAYSDGGRAALKNVLSGDIFASSMGNAVDYYTLSLDPGKSTAHYKETFSEENSNFFFTVTDESGAVLLKNYSSPDYRYSRSENYSILVNEKHHSHTLSFKNYQDRWNYIEECQERYFNVDYSAWDEDTDGDGNFECVVNIEYSSGDVEEITVTGYVKDELSAPDRFATASFWMEKLINMRFLLIALAIVCFVCAVFLFAFLICSAGHKEGVEGIHLNWVDRIPFDLYLLFMAFALFACYALMDELRHGAEEIIIGAALLVPLALLLIMSLVMSFAARAKAGEWWKNTIIFRVLKLIKRFLSWLLDLCKSIARAMPFIWKLALIWLAISIIELLCILAFGLIGALLPLWFIEKILLTALLLTAAMNMQRLQKGGHEIAAGNLSHSIDLKHMLWDFKKHAEDLNSISGGMQRAVDERMKSEHLKTELITNVSHDIKTPITSIVNYVDLLKKENLGSEKAAEYVQVLDRQSMRLKKLTEDLVEASKASTGNIPVNIECVNCSLLLSQAIGEYEDRLNERQLELIQDSDGPTEIWADGKLMWRVFDNLLSNVCKYALEGTRVYVSAEPREDQLIITFKNISNYPLNISSEELMERFVRGDTSRSTEGSGLGLSIAKSLTELQNGTFELIIDGDLFKAQLSFPLCVKPQGQTSAN
ncbi:MAG: sensor histidine kinase [Oscillospiraceae bacterium]|nr:sensor histidine kinase [Oscillospiraceae bacterium]